MTKGIYGHICWRTCWLFHLLFGSLLSTSLLLLYLFQFITDWLLCIHCSGRALFNSAQRSAFWVQFFLCGHPLLKAKYDREVSEDTRYGFKGVLRWSLEHNGQSEVLKGIFHPKMYICWYFLSPSKILFSFIFFQLSRTFKSFSWNSIDWLLLNQSQFDLISLIF